MPATVNTDDEDRLMEGKKLKPLSMAISRAWIESGEMLKPSLFHTHSAVSSTRVASPPRSE